MTMLFTVYDAKGEPFEVRPDQAKHLVIVEGWSMTPPAAASEPEPHAVPETYVEAPPLPANYQSDEPAPKPVNG